MRLDEVNGLDRERFVEKFGPLYERSPWVAGAACGRRPFGSLAGMHGAFERAVREATPGRRLALIKAHPELAGEAVAAGELTPDSAREQSGAGLDRLSPRERGSFARLNRAYKEKFGFPLIVAVRGHTGASILGAAEARLQNTRDEEVERALEEIGKIARYRLEEIVEEGA